MTETLHLEGLDFALSRSRQRSTIGITIEREGELTVAAPAGTPLATIEAAVRGKLFWVFAKLAEKSLLFQPAPVKEYISGEGFHYLGRSYRLLLTDVTEGNGTARLRLSGGRFLLSRRDKHRAPEIFTQWYAEHAMLWLRRRVELLANRVGERPKDIRVRELANRWGRALKMASSISTGGSSAYRRH